MPGPRWLTAAVLVALAPPVSAGVAVVANATDRDVPCEVRHANGEPRRFTLAPGESRAVRVGKEPTLVVGAETVRIDPYHAYAVAARGGTPAVRGVELAGKMPIPDDVPDAPPAVPKPVRFPVTLLADDAEPRARAVWEKALRARVSAAAEVIEQACGVRVEVVAVAEWNSDPAAKDFSALRKDFETAATPEKGTVAVGFTSRKAAAANGGTPTPNGTAGPLRSHVLLRENFPRTEAERVELLVHEFARLLGAVRSPDRFTVMRSRLDDQLATHAKHRLHFDPLNLLALNVVADELRTGKVARWDDLGSAAKDRLRVVYDTVAKAMPDDPLPAALAKTVAPEVAAKVPDPPAVNDVPRPKDPEKPKEPEKPKVDPKVEATRKVVKAVALRADDLRRLPEPAPGEADADGKRPRGDRLTAELVRAAADVAGTLDDNLKAPAFLLGLGIALDDSPLVRSNPAAKEFWEAVETETERKERVASLGVPTVRHRRDLCQHFFVSAALAVHLGPDAAESAGVAKELLDSVRPSGFSFVDLAADLGGIAFAERVRKDPGLVDRYARGFDVADHAPKVDGLVEGLSAAKFLRDYGSADDARFKKAMADVRSRVWAVPANK